jgi:hypothetical protein
MVWAYRAIPKDARPGIRPGDWVTTSRAYAREHGEAALNGDYVISSMRVPAGSLWSEGNSIHEWGYHP